MKDTLGRRDLLRLGLTTGTVMAVTGLVLPESVLAAGAPGLIQTLNVAVDKENRAVWAYHAAAGTGHLSKPVAKLAGEFMGQHKEHAAALAAVVRKLGGHPAAPRSEYDLSAYHPDLSNQTGIIHLALALESDAVRAYYGAVGALQDKSLRQTAAGILADEAMHVAVLRNALGLNPVPMAFITGKQLEA